MLGDVLRDARIRAGLRLTDVAKQVGISHQYLSHLENNHKPPSLKTLCRLGKVLHISSRAIGQLVRALDGETSPLPPYVLITRSLPLPVDPEED